MASRKCNGTLSHRGHAIGAGPAGGIGGVAPDGDCSAQSRAANYAGKWLANSCPAPRPEKQGLCGQAPRRYYSASNGKSFRPIMSSGECPSYEVARQAKRPAHVVQSRMEQGSRLRSMYRSLGWSRADCAKFLHVTERCLHNWERGRHAIPFAAYKLIRLHLGYELPGRDWDGWSISRGRLCTPEGHELNPLDAKWWHLLCRRAETGVIALRQLRQLKAREASDGAPDASACAASGAAVRATADAQRGRREAPRLDLSIEHISTRTDNFGRGTSFDAINFAPISGQWSLTGKGVQP